MELFNNWLTSTGIAGGLSIYISNGIAITLIILLGFTANFIAKKLILMVLVQYIKNNRFKWANILLEKKVFTRLSHIAPAIVITAFAGVFPQYQGVIQRFSLAYMIIVGIFSIDALLDAAEDIYKTFEVSKVKPIKSIVQVFKIFLYLIGGIWLVSIIIDRSPLLLLSGIGALSAVIMLVFKDSMLGLAAGMQLAANDMVRIGDWIEMPKYGADGDVIDITLNTVKVQNFDNTVTTIPTYAMISDSFKNWRVMQESGGRRIKRSIYIDTTSIKFCSDEMLGKFEKIQYIAEYIQNKKLELAEYNRVHNVDPSQLVNGRRLTNIGTFRAYLKEYLKNHPHIHNGMTQIVRHLPPAEYGLPIEIYAFTNNTAWVNYESIQADIFDHILAVVPQFDLRIHQNPTGYDMRLMTIGSGSNVDETSNQDDIYWPYT
ncbi:MAG: mechanosensitive ion channel family protein [Desulfotomaculaceae bacterium]|nr:mechanosensitive ion channel family protein [Desulfotomaculaceae bacterium]